MARTTVGKYRISPCMKISADHILLRNIGMLICLLMLIFTENPFTLLWVNQVLPNFPGFAEAFHCSPGSKMVSKDRCSIW
ncbi:hypothetical protein COOONC_01638 [Cooperia oncophora]